MAASDDFNRLSRRGLLAGAAAMTSAPCWRRAQPAPRAKGPIVWLDMDQKELDDAYDQAVYAPNRDIVIKRCVRNSELARERIGAPKRLSTGRRRSKHRRVHRQGAERTGDDLRARRRLAGRHGRAIPLRAEMFLNAGAHYVVQTSTMSATSAANLLTMADQIRRSVAWTVKNAKSFGGDAERIYVSGHSSGGHWAACCSPPTGRRTSAAADCTRAGCAAAACTNSRPVRLSAAFELCEVHRRGRAAAQLGNATSTSLSRRCLVLRHARDAGVQRQSREFAAASRRAGKPATLSVMEGYNHFEVMESIGNPYSLFGRAALT